jgi:hypothetical protein
MGGWSQGTDRWTLAALLGCVALLILAPAAVAAGTGKISGTVTSAASKADLEHIEVTVYEAGGKESLVGSAVTEARGEYTVTGLKSGSYTVVFYPVYGSGLNFVSQYYKDTPFPKDATLLDIKKEGETGKADAELQEGGEMSGTVTDAGTHKPLAGAGVVAYPLGAIEEGFRGHAVTNTNGEYTIFGLEPGKYIVEFESPGGSGGEYSGQLYNGQSSPLKASPVTAVQGSAPAPSIDAALVRKAPVNTVSPVVAGTPAVGQILSCTGDSWTGAPKLSFTYQWLRNGVAIAGANGTLYGVQAADLRTGLSCAVTATNEYGHTAAVSNTLTVPAPPSPAHAPTPPPPPPRPEVELSSAKLLVSGSSVRVPIACAKATCRGTIELTEQIFVESRHGETVVILDKRLLLGRGSYALIAGHSATIVVSLTGTGKNALARAKHHRLNAMTSVSVTDGTAIQGPVVVSELVHTHRRR